MHDREFTKPAAVQLKNPSPQVNQPIILYNFEMYMGEYVWSYAKWNEDGWDDAQMRIGEAIELTPEGGTIKLSLDDWEKLREANKAAEIKGPYAHKVRKLQKAIKNARKPGDEPQVEGVTN